MYCFSTVIEKNVIPLPFNPKIMFFQVISVYIRLWHNIWSLLFPLRLFSTLFTISSWCTRYFSECTRCKLLKSQCSAIKTGWHHLSIKVQCIKDMHFMKEKCWEDKLYCRLIFNPSFVHCPWTRWNWLKLCLWMIDKEQVVLPTKTNLMLSLIQRILMRCSTARVCRTHSPPKALSLSPNFEAPGWLLVSGPSPSSRWVSFFFSSVATFLLLVELVFSWIRMNKNPKDPDPNPNSSVY